MTKRILCYTAGRTGIGQLMRLLRVASLLSTAAEVSVISGIPDAEKLFSEYPAQMIYLEDLSSFTIWGRSTGPAAASDHNVARIARTLWHLVQRVRPDVFLTSHYNGATGELSAIYPLLRSTGCKILLGLRDIYDFAHDIDYWKEDFRSILERYIDRVLVFGTEGTRSYLPIEYMPPKHRSSLAFVGYTPPALAQVSTHTRQTSNNSASEDTHSEIRVLCQSGGGFDGEDVTLKCIEAICWLVFSQDMNVHLDISFGPLMRKERKAQIWEKSRFPFIRTGDFLVRHPKDLLSYSIEVAMAGYNTCVEAAYYGLPAVLIPREYPDDEEQAIRASFFAPIFPNLSVFPYFQRSTSPSELGTLIMERVSKQEEVMDLWMDNFFADSETLRKAALRP